MAQSLLYRVLDRLGYRPLDAGVDGEVFRRDLITVLLTLSGAILITVISVWEIAIGREPAAMPKYTLAFGLAITAYYVISLAYRRFSVSVAVVCMFALHFFWLITGDIANSGMLWCLLTAALFVHLLGHRVGTFMVSIAWLGSAALLMWPERPWIIASYSDDLSLYFLLAYAVFGWFSFMVEYIRYRTEQRLKSTTEQLRAAARTDELTGLPNRRGLREFMRSPQQEARQQSACTSIMVGDLDHFKQINDGFGHDAGDRVLQRVSGTLKSLLRGQDLVARWGGEEFIVVLQDTDAVGARQAAEKILNAVRDLEVTFDGQRIDTTISLGLSVLGPGESLETALKAADQALFAAKRKGRNRLEISTAS